MRPDLTAALALALERAGHWAARLDANVIEPLHVLLGLLDEEEGRAALLLGGAGLNDAGAIRRTALQGRPELVTTGNPAPLPMGRAVRELLALANEMGFLLASERAISTDQVLLAVVRHDAALRQDLERLGLNVARLEVNILGPQGPPLHLDEPLNLHEPPEQVDVARLLDAAGNRAREGLRVLEDYCRFVLDDAFLTRGLKQLRHDLVAVLSRLSGGSLLEARDTPGDVGTSIATDQERERNSLADVIQANARRLQESLRTLEEFSKLQAPAVGEVFESLRYRVYTLERALTVGSAARQRLAGANLYVLLSEESCRASLAGTIAEVAAGGAQIVQLREKELDDRALLERAREVRACTRKAGVLLIINDRPDIARLVDADGVHLGQDDLPVQQARRIMGAGYLIGVSTHNIDQVRQAIRDGASYIGVGPTFPSATKSFEHYAGLDFIRQATAETTLPAFAIGGITGDNLPQVLVAGARRIAVGQALCQAEDPRKLARQMRRALESRHA
ncbi:MAG: thiamine phosphate synthase [Planctomycetes bacterium]|nr:thiamine phosphate synthase [Planctomycetota bacterium]